LERKSLEYYENMKISARCRELEENSRQLVKFFMKRARSWEGEEGDEEKNEVSSCFQKNVISGKEGCDLVPQFPTSD